MSAKKKMPPQWEEARKRHRLSDAHVRMARELGLNPRKLGGIDNHRQERWKAPLPDFIERIYFKRFGKVLGPPAAAHIQRPRTQELLRPAPPMAQWLDEVPF